MAVMLKNGRFTSTLLPQPKPKPQQSVYKPTVYNAQSGKVVPPQSVFGASKLPTGGSLGTQAPSAPSGGNPNFNFNDVLEQQQEQPGIDFDALIAPAISALESQISPLEQGGQQQIGEVNTRYDTQLEKNKQSLSANLGEVDTAEGKQKTIAEQSTDQSRRQFSEIQQGLQALYGQSTGTGAFAAELAGRQTLRNIGDVNTGLQQSLEELTKKRIQIRDVARLVDTEIENNRKEEIGQIQREVRDRISSINSQVGVLKFEKAKLAMEASQIAQRQIAEINARNASFKQQLYVQQQAADQKIQEIYARGKNVVESISIQDLDRIRRENPWIFTPGSNTKLTGQVDVGGGRTLGFGMGSPELTEEQKRQQRINAIINGE